MHYQSLNYQPLPSVPPSRPMAALAKRQSITAMVTAIVLGGLGTMLMMLEVLQQPLAYSLSVAPAFMVVTALGVWFYWWLDRWEPEPPGMLLGAFLWGAGVATLISGLINTIVAITTRSWELTTVVSAPLVEETTKGLFLVLFLLTTRRGRAELNSAVDAIVYAGFVGLGFTLVEDISYALRGMSVEEGLQIAHMRILTGAFLHSLFTTLTALGVWAGVNARGLMRLVWPLLGWAAAVALHAMHNFAAGVGVTGLVVAVSVELVVYVVIITAALRSRRGEQENLRRQLPALVAQGWISPREGGWLANRAARSEQLGLASVEGRAQVRLLKDFIQNATELCFLRSRLDRRPPQEASRESLQTHAMLVGLLTLQRPLVDRLLANSSSWQPMAGRMGHGYGAELPSRRR